MINKEAFVKKRENGFVRLCLLQVISVLIICICVLFAARVNKPLFAEIKKEFADLMSKDIDIGGYFSAVFGDERNAAVYSDAKGDSSSAENGSIGVAEADMVYADGAEDNSSAEAVPGFVDIAAAGSAGSFSGQDNICAVGSDTPPAQFQSVSGNTYPEKTLDGTEKNEVSAAAFLSASQLSPSAKTCFSVDCGSKRTVDSDAFSLYSYGVVMPVNGIISSDYGYRIHPIYNTKSFHSGRDIAAPEGSRIYAALDGIVAAAREAEKAGNYIVLRHGGGIETRYCHCSVLIAKEGTKVRKGDVIALVGQTGLATGPHLHFEYRVDGKAEDPEILLAKARHVY